MRLSDYEKKQWKVLDAFYKDFFTWSASNLFYWMVTGIFIFVLGIMMLIPFQEFIADSDFPKGMIFYFGGMGTVFYLIPYVSFNEKQKPMGIYGLLKHLPISVKTIKFYRMKKMLVFLLKIEAVYMVLQLLVAMVGCREIVLGNILYPFIYGFAVPLFFGGLYIILVE